MKNENNNVNTTNYNPLLYAIFKNNNEISRLLLNYKNIDINVKDCQKNTPLFRAVYNENIEIVRLLLYFKNIDINAKNSENETALFRAVYNENIEIVRLLMTFKNIDANREAQLTNKTEAPIHHAIRNKSIDIAKILLESGQVDLAIKYKYKYKYYYKEETPLYCAIDEEMNYDTINLVLSQEKIDVNSKHIYNNISKRKISGEERIYVDDDDGYDIEEHREDEITPLFRAIDKHLDYNIIQLLINKDGIDVNLKRHTTFVEKSKS